MKKPNFLADSENAPIIHKPRAVARMKAGIFATIALIAMLFCAGCTTFVWDPKAPPEKCFTLELNSGLQLKQIDKKPLRAQISKTTIQKIPEGFREIDLIYYDGRYIASGLKYSGYFKAGKTYELYPYLLGTRQVGEKVGVCCRELLPNGTSSPNNAPPSFRPQRAPRNGKNQRGDFQTPFFHSTPPFG